MQARINIMSMAGKKILLLIVAFGAMTSMGVAQNISYSNKEVAADLEYLKTALEQNHPNLYTYSSKEQIDQWFATQIATLPNTISEKEAFKIVTSISPVLKDGHSYIYPSAQHLERFFSSAPLFPLDVFLIQDSLVVVGNLSDEQNIPLGAVLTKINGVETKDIQSLIVEHTCRDGANVEYPKHLYYQFFKAYYSYFFGFQESFQVEYFDENGTLLQATIRGLKRDEIKVKRTSEYGTGITLQLLPNTKSAVLTIKSFDVEILKKDYHQNFKRTIKQAFKMIEKQGVKHLAIDLRDNQGGALKHGVYLLKHVMNDEFQCVDSYYKLKGGQRKRLHFQWDDYFKPKKKHHFKGDVYVFINGGSYSCSAIVANTFKENKRGKIVGQMSGGSAYVNSGAPNRAITLPNSKISFTIPRTQYNLRKDLSHIGVGVTPDITVLDRPNRIIGNRDDYIETFEALIKK